MIKITFLFSLVLIAFQQTSSVAVDDVKYYLYTPRNADAPVEINLGFSKQRKTVVEPSKIVKILCHGYTDNSTSYWVEPTKSAFLKRSHMNIISVDWSAHAFGAYSTATKKAPQIGDHIARLVVEMHNRLGIPYSDFHLIGHSLGSHISGYAGKKVFAETGEKIGRITGLDPAGPSFNGNDIDHRLSTDDALFVDAIHTDTTIFGYKKSIGHADFWPNGGSSQNGCSLLSNCSHCRAPTYFFESIGSMDFPAWICDSIKNFKKGKCTGNAMAIMGDNCDTSARGNYYLTTNKASPFGINAY